jgi:hypothetical protein
MSKSSAARTARTVSLAPNVKVRVTINDRLETRLTSYLRMSAEINELIEAKKALQAKILADAPEGYESDEWKVTTVKSVSAGHVSKELLVKLGVSAKVIQKATVPGVAYSFPKITNKTEAKEKQAARRAAKEESES